MTISDQPRPQEKLAIKEKDLAGEREETEIVVLHP
jgi:hypothetical protein